MSLLEKIGTMFSPRESPNERRCRQARKPMSYESQMEVNLRANAFRNSPMRTATESFMRERELHHARCETALREIKKVAYRDRKRRIIIIDERAIFMHPDPCVQKILAMVFFDLPTSASPPPSAAPPSPAGEDPRPPTPAPEPRDPLGPGGRLADEPL